MRRHDAVRLSVKAFHCRPSSIAPYALTCAENLHHKSGSESPICVSFRPLVAPRFATRRAIAAVETKFLRFFQPVFVWLDRAKRPGKD